MVSLENHSKSNKMPCTTKIRVSSGKFNFVRKNNKSILQMFLNAWSNQLIFSLENFNPRPRECFNKAQSADIAVRWAVMVAACRKGRTWSAAGDDEKKGNITRICLG